jgi:hypothetical protein
MDEALVKKISELDVLQRPSFNKTTKDYYIVAVVPTDVAERYEFKPAYYDCTKSGGPHQIQSDCCVFPYTSYYGKPIKYGSRETAEKKLAVWKDQIESAKWEDNTGNVRTSRLSQFNAMLGDPATEFAVIEIETHETAQNTYSVLTN